MEIHNQKLTPKSFLNTLAIYHLAFTFAPLAFGLFVLYTMNVSKLNFDNFADPLLYILSAVGVVSVFLSNYLYKMHINSLKEKPSLREKISGFQAAIIVSLAPLEGASLLATFAADNYSNIFYLIVSAGLICCIFYRRPTKDKIARDLELNSAQKNQFNKNEEFID